MSSRFRFVANAAGSALSSASEYMSGSTAAQAKGVADSWIRGWKGEPRNDQFSVNLQPGWAVKRPRASGGESGTTAGTRSPAPAQTITECTLEGDLNAYDIVLSISGLCPAVDLNLPATRTQRALVSVAKRLAALPMLALNDNRATTPVRSAPSDPILPTAQAFKDSEALYEAHNNLDKRLRPFWSTVAAFRPLRLIIRAGQSHHPRSQSQDDNQYTLYETVLSTDAQGHFVTKIIIPWESLCTYPPIVAKLFADLECSTLRPQPALDLLVIAELLPHSSLGSDASARIPSVAGPGDANDLPQNNLPTTPITNDSQSSVESACCLATAEMALEVSESDGVRVLSDLDDTVKHSDILAGPREVFRNVFCRPLEDAIVRGMDELYRSLDQSGVNGFHYVSNSPLELLPMVKDFFRIHDFPLHFSLKLKPYGRRSLMTSLFETPGDRKRNAVLEIFDAFCHSTFILVGDSGEQDLELYTSIARERPSQVLAILIRDVTSSRASKLKGNPIYEIAAATTSQSSPASETHSSEGSPTPISSRDSNSGLVAAPASTQPLTTLRQTLEDLQELTTAEQRILKRAAMWDDRVSKATAALPSGVPLFLFKAPAEIRDAILDIVAKNRRS